VKKVKLIGQLLFAALSVTVFCVPAFAAALKPIPGQFIVLYKESKVPPAIKGQAAASDRGAKLNMIKLRSSQTEGLINQHLTKSGIQQHVVMHKFSNVVSGFSAKLSPAEVTKLKGDPDIAGVFQDFEVSLGPIPVSTAAPAGSTASTQYVSCTIQKAGGPGPDATNRAQWIWILDTGINSNHPDLNVRATHARSFISGQSWEDGHGHGTHCAGIAAARNNGFGVVGASPGAPVVPVKVLDNSGHGSFSGILAGLNYVAAHDIVGDVVSMSIGTDPISNCLSYVLPINQAIYNLTVAGTWVVMAAGNNGVCGGAAHSLPGCIYAAPIGGQWQQLPRAVTVGSIECNGTRAGYSNWGPRPPMDWVAVGSNVYSTYKYRSYATMSGTSMATPAVAGIIHARGGNPPAMSGTATACGLVVPVAHR